MGIGINSVGLNNNVSNVNFKSANCSGCGKPRHIANELNADTVSFTSRKKDIEDIPKKKSSKTHKALVAATGFLVPGLGQALNGQWGKAIGFFAGAPALVLAASMINPVLGFAVGVGAEVKMFTDAYKNA